MEIIDAHHHLWDRGRFGYSWLAQVPGLDRDYLLSDYEDAIAGSGVTGSVHVQADVDEKFSIQETRWILSLADAGGTVAGVVAWAPVERPDLEEYLDKLGTHPRLKGVRRLIQGESDPEFCARPEFIAGVRKLGERDLSFDICVYHHQLPAVLKLVRSAPETSFVLDHIGKPAIADGLGEPWKTHIHDLASFDNVTCKLSGLVTEADWGSWTAADLQPYRERVIEVFGFERLMFGSDWPVATLATEYGRWLDVVEESVKHASSGERRALFHDTAKRFYRL